MGKNKSKNPRNKKSHKAPKPTIKRKKELIFDPEARDEYLKGFSERKRQRRVFGLAMQQVKDRKAKLEERAEARKAELEQIEQREQQKDEALESYLRENGILLKTLKKVEATEDNVDQVEEYHDEQTMQQWGGEVTVSISTHIPGESDNEQEGGSKPKHKGKDLEQEMHSSVDKYIAKVKGNMPGKKKSQHKAKKGQHGAASMKGMAQGSDLKLVKKILSKSKAKKSRESRKNKV